MRTPPRQSREVEVGDTVGDRTIVLIDRIKGEIILSSLKG